MSTETPGRPVGRRLPRPERRPGSYREPILLAERGVRELVTGWCLVGVALAGDLAAFFIVLAVLFETAPMFILAVSLGFAVGAIIVTHAIGKELAERRCADPKAHTVLLAGAVGAWLLLGLTAFVARYRFGPEKTGDTGAVFPSGALEIAPATSGNGQALAAAGLFAALYLASGLGAIYVSYRWFNPWPTPTVERVATSVEPSRPRRRAGPRWFGPSTCSISTNGTTSARRTAGAPLASRLSP